MDSTRIFIFLPAAFLLGAAEATAITFGSYQCDLVSDHEQRNEPNTPKPGYLEPITDPVFGTTITRITGEPGTPISKLGGVWGQNARHHYSTDAVWNATQSLIFLEDVDGISEHLFLDGETYEPRFTREGVEGEVRWDPKRPGIMNYLTTSCAFGRWHVRSDRQRVRMEVSGYTDCELGPWDGNFSFDANWAVALATRSTDGEKVVFAVDIANERKYSDIVLADHGVTDLDWASISALGNYIVVNADLHDEYLDTTTVFDLNGNTVQQWTEYGRPSHYDLSVNVHGDEVAVGVSKSESHEGLTIMRRLADGVITPLTISGWSSHHSTRNYDLPDWAFVTGGGEASDEVFAVRLDDSLTIARLASTRTSGEPYPAEAHAVPSPDGTRVMFASDWGQDNGVQSYVIDLRPLCAAADPGHAGAAARPRSPEGD
jgi:hypothetical protein